MGEPRLPSYPHPPSTFDQPTFSLTTLLFSVSLDRYLRSSLRYLPLLTASATIIVAVSSSPQPSQLQPTTINMATEEDLIDYSDEELGTNDAAPAGRKWRRKEGRVSSLGRYNRQEGFLRRHPLDWFPRFPVEAGASACHYGLRFRTSFGGSASLYPSSNSRNRCSLPGQIRSR